MADDSSPLQSFAERYTEAWCSGDPGRVAGFFSPEGRLQVNDDAPAVGRAAITAVAQSFMTAFPDLRVMLDQLLLPHEGPAEYHWTLTGTNTGPGGSGNPVRISGVEKWTLGEDGLIASSLGSFDTADYLRQLG